MHKKKKRFEDIYNILGKLGSELLIPTFSEEDLFEKEVGSSGFIVQELFVG